MPPAFDDAPAVQHQNAVAIDDAGKPVGEDQGRTPAHEAVECCLDKGLVLGVDRRQGFVKHEDRRIAEQRASDRHALTLAARQLDALLADDRAISLRQAGDKVMDVRGPGRGNDIGLRGLRTAHADIVFDAAVKQERVLVHHRNHGANLGEGKRTQILSANADAAFVRVIETQQQAHDRGFPAARGADDADPLARGDLNVEPLVNDAPGRRVGEADILEGDRRLQRCGKVRIGRVGDQRPVVQYGVDALGRGHAHHPLVEHGPELAHRAIDFNAQHQDDQKRGQGHGAGFDAQCTQGKRGRCPTGNRAVGDSASQHIGPQHPHGTAEEIVRLDFQLVGARPALAEGLQRRQPLN